MGFSRVARPGPDRGLDIQLGRGNLGDFFALMGQMGAELFDLPWVEAVALFFGNFAWALYITGIVVAGFECAVEAQNGRGDIKATCLNF